MKVLWVSASAIGPASKILEDKYAGSSGTWIQTIYEEICSEGKPEMFFLCFSKDMRLGMIQKKTSLEGTAFRTYMPNVSLGRTAPQKLKHTVEKIIAEVSPDIIHIWGTETCVQNLVAECALSVPKVVFIQGIIGIHDRYHNCKLAKYGIKYHKGLKDCFRDYLHSALFHRQVEFEKKELTLAKNVIIDNDFSKAYCASISNEIVCHYYPLCSRSDFSVVHWNYSTCSRNTIFTVFGPTQDKGLFQLIRALTVVKKTFPDVKLLLPGKYDIQIDGDTYHGHNSYEKLICTLIEKNQLSDHVCFLGKLSQNEMAKELSKAHIFVNPSAMEVHAGSLREALTVGTPSISSYCGSVGEFMREGENGLIYRFEEYEILAQKIIMLLSNPELCMKLSAEARIDMQKRRDSINKSMLDIYSDIISANSVNATDAE